MHQERYRKSVEIALIILGTLQAGYGGWHADYLVMMLGSVYAIIGGTLLGTRFSLDGR
ncbi:hypothetical protein [Halovivax sp.]|uniref:hypothetical protein n=1 Tax=Halovivax sp. TaxID=1935978 RepID=UPI0025B9AFC2|nr:hypothetical protein [Halovivax sp.]